jgi:hypothetical protein
MGSDHRSSRRYPSLRMRFYDYDSLFAIGFD